MICPAEVCQCKTHFGEVYVTLGRDDSSTPFETFVTCGKSGSDVMAVCEALGRIISLVLRMPSTWSGNERLQEIVRQLSGIGGGGSTRGSDHRKITSLPDAVAYCLEKLIKPSSFSLSPSSFPPSSSSSLPPSSSSSTPSLSSSPSSSSSSPPSLPSTHPSQKSVSEDCSSKPANADGVHTREGHTSTREAFCDICPSCAQLSLTRQEGCKNCMTPGCGYSACS